MTNEWDNTPWAGTLPPPTRSRGPVYLTKAVTGAGVSAIINGTPLEMFTQDPTRRMAAFLRAYRVGWFYKAESKISRDLANLSVQVMPEDAAGDNEAAIVPPDLDLPFESLQPVDQFLRLMERPNPYYTGRMLRQKTQIRRDMAGAAFWWLEGGDGGGLPTAIYGISPSRMWPAYDQQGAIIGWVLDKDKPGGGVPFTTTEILPFINASPDDTYGPMGVVEAVFAELPLTERLAVHTSDLLATGGRLAGMLWPKNRGLDEDEFLDAQRAWRNVSSDPNAARRLLLFPEPMEWAPGAASPTEIGIPELAALNRDNILTAFPISPYQLGVPMPGGLNSAETRREDRRDYWEGTIHPRVEDFEEDVQVGLLERYEQAVGQTLDFEVQEPNLDDADTLLKKTLAFKGLVAIGFDPDAAVEAVKLEHIKFNGLPEMLDPVHQQEMQEAAVEAQANRPVVEPPPPPRQITATSTAKVDRRSDILGRELTGFRQRMDDFLRQQQARIVERLWETLPKTKAGRKAVSPDWWDAEGEDAALEATLRDPYGRVTRQALGTVADTMGRVITRDRIGRVLEANLQAAGSRIHGINEATREAIAEALTEGTRRGYSIPQLIDGVPAEGFKGVREAPLKNGSPAFDELRAETIARTETMIAYNDAALRGYGSYGVAEVQAIDGDQDEECASRDGQVFTLDDALGVLDHPNGTLDWIPIVPDGKTHTESQPVVVNVAPPTVPIATKTRISRDGDDWVIVEEPAWTGS